MKAKPSTHKRRPKWPKKVANAMCSPWFFGGSFVVGALLGVGPLDAIGSRSMEHGQRPDPRMVVIATVPDPSTPGSRRVEPVFYSALADFRAANPGASLLPPDSSGKVERAHRGVVAEYSVEPADGEAVTVETKFRQDFVSVRARYVATATEVRPLTTKAGAVYQPLLIGLGIAALLGVIGRAWKYLVQQEEARGRL